jgi:uncharacterized membrane-anchored protein YhcB (DUF1043 family)
MRKQTLTTWGKSMIGLIAFITTVGASVWYVGKPPFANEALVQSQFQQYEKRFDAMRLNEVDAQVVKLENEKSRRRLSEVETDLLRRLYSERKQLLCQLKIDKCG